MRIKDTIRQFILDRLGLNFRFQQTLKRIDNLYCYLNQHHSEVFGRTRLSQWAHLHHVDMEEVKMNLRDILNTVR